MVKTFSESLYFWLFKHAMTNRAALFMWRKLIALMAVIKHAKRLNFKQTKVWLKQLVFSKA